jgi:hypothetical protein
LDPEQALIQYKTISFSYDGTIRETDWTDVGRQEPPGAGASHITKIMFRLQGPLSDRYKLAYRTWSGFFRRHFLRDNGWVQAGNGHWSDDTNSPVPTTWISRIQIAIVDPVPVPAVASDPELSREGQSNVALACEVLDKNGSIKAGTNWLLENPAPSSVPAASGEELIVIHLEDTSAATSDEPRNFLRGSQLAEFRNKLKITVSTTGKGTGTVPPFWITPGRGRGAPVSLLLPAEHVEAGFLVGDAVDVTRSKVGDLVIVKAELSDASGSSTSTEVYFKYFKPFDLYEESLLPVPGLHFAALNTYSISLANAQVSLNPLMVAWGGKWHAFRDFYFGASIAGFLTITPDVNTPQNSNIQQFTLALLIDLNNYASFGAGSFWNFKDNSWAVNLLASVDSGILDLLKGH